MTKPFLFVKVFFLMLFFQACNSEKKVDDSELKKFELLDASRSNIHFNNKISENLYNFFSVYNYAYNGGGVAIGDINNDGLSDIYFTGNQVQDKLYINKGDFEFEDITLKSGLLRNSSWHNGVVMVDINGDNLLDIYVCKGGWNDKVNKRKNLLYVNQGNSKFKEEASRYGIDDSGFSMMASFFDFDADGDLDLYLVNRPKDFFMSVAMYKKLRSENNPSYTDKLYVNENGKFYDHSLEKGLKNNLGNGLGIVTSDLDKDGKIDVYVANDYFGNDYLYKNSNGVFHNTIKKSVNHTAFYGMGVDVFDCNNDGLEDIIELDMTPEDYVRSKTNMASMSVEQFRVYVDEGFHYQYMHNMLQLNQGNNQFSEISQLANLSKTDWSWSCLGADFDNDGLKDIFITNGFKRDIWNKDSDKKYIAYTKKGIDKTKTKDQIIKDIVEFYPSNKLSNYVFQNNGNLQFKNKAKEWGLDIPSFSNGAAFADLDNDGDIDLVVNNIDDKAFVYKNNSDRISKNNYLKLKLNGPKGNNYGLGAKVTVFHNDSIQYQDFKTVRGYLSSVEPLVHFGLGKLKRVDSIKVKWLDGKTNILTNTKSNQRLVVEYSKAKEVNKAKSIDRPVFEEVTHDLLVKSIKHKENEYDDYKHQILLPHKLSTLGPALAVADINNDGLDDFYIGGAKGYSGKVFFQRQAGKFEEQNLLVFNKDKEQEDVDAFFVDVDNDKDLDLYVVSGGNEAVKNDDYYKDRLYVNNNGSFVKSNYFPEIRTSGAKVLPLDFDNDGDMDLFIGSRHVPREYPKPASSFLLENQNGKYVDVTSSKAPKFNEMGLVTDALVADIDGDSIEELFIIGEWMQIRVFKNQKGAFKEITKDIGLSKTYGWWNTIEAGDIDNDGDIDMVVGNLGLNYKFKASEEKPFYVYASDYDQNGTQDVFLAKQIKGKIVPVRGKECSTQQLPGLAKKFGSYSEFANAGVLDILGEDQSKAIKYKAEQFASVVLENEKGVFKIKELPIEAQFSTVNGIVIEDYNQDGNKDIVIGGNRFNVEIETTRSDASIGLLMLGDGKGNFKALSASQSGLVIPYNVKHVKSINLGGDKGVLVGVNNGNTLLYKVSN